MAISLGKEIKDNSTKAGDQKNNGDNNLINNATVVVNRSAGASVAAALLSGIFGSINQTKLKGLEKIRAQENALLDYQYEARKRLYKEFEPLLFQLYELSSRASKHVFSLARYASQGNLQQDKGWLSDKTSYHTTLTLFIFLAPLAIFKLMERKLTRVKTLTWIPSHNNQYFLAKALYRSCLHDFKLADTPPKLPYDSQNDMYLMKKKENIVKNTIDKD